MKAIRIFSFCSLYMVVSVHTEEIKQKLNETIREGLGDSARYEQNLQQGANDENDADNFKHDRQVTSGVPGPSDRIELWPPPYQTPFGPWHDPNSNAPTSPSNQNMDEVFLQQNSHIHHQHDHFDQNVHSDYLQPTPSIQSSSDWISILNPTSTIQHQSLQTTPCKNGDTLKRILGSILMLLLQPVNSNSPTIGTINGVLNTLEFQIKSDGLQNMELYPKLQTLERTLRAGSPSTPFPNIMYENKSKIGSPDCDAAFLKLVVLAYTLYKQLSKYPDCNDCPFSKGSNYWKNPQQSNQFLTNTYPGTNSYQNLQNNPYQNPTTNPHLYSEVYPYPDPQTNSFLNLQTGPSPDTQKNPFVNPQTAPNPDQTNNFINSKKDLYLNFLTNNNFDPQTGASSNFQLKPFQNSQTINTLGQANPFLNSQNSPYQNLKKYLLLNQQIEPTPENSQKFISSDSLTNSYLNLQKGVPLDFQNIIYQRPQPVPASDSQTNQFLNPQSFSIPNSNTYLNPQTVSSSDTQNKPILNPQTLSTPDTEKNSSTNAQTSPSLDLYQNTPLPTLQTNPGPATRTSAYPEYEVPQLEVYSKPQTQPYQNPQNYLKPTQQRYPGSQTDSNQPHPYSTQEQNKPYANFPNGQEFWTSLQNYIKPSVNLQLPNTSNAKMIGSPILISNQEYLQPRGSPDKNKENQKSQSIFEKDLRSSSPTIKNYSIFLQNLDSQDHNRLFPKKDKSESKSSVEDKFDQSLKQAEELVRKLKDERRQPTPSELSSDIREKKGPPTPLPLHSEISKNNGVSGIMLPYKTQDEIPKLKLVFPTLKFISGPNANIQTPVTALKTAYERLRPSNISEPLQSRTLPQIPDQIYSYVLNRPLPTDPHNTPLSDQLNTLYYPQSNNLQRSPLPISSLSNQYKFLPVSSILPLEQNNPIAKSTNALLRQGINSPTSYKVPFHQFDQINSNAMKLNDLLQHYPKHFDSEGMLGPCLHNLCNQILTSDPQPKVVNIFLSPHCKEFSESQKLFLVQLLQHFRIPQSGHETDRQNQESLKHILEHLEPDSNKQSLFDDKVTDSNRDGSDIYLPFNSFILQLIESSLFNSEDKQITKKLVKETIQKLTAQGIDFSKKENLNLLLVFVQNIISQILNPANTPPTIDSDNPFRHLPGANPDFLQYLHEMISKLVENVQERKIIISQLLVYINNLIKYGYDFRKQETMNLVIGYLNLLVSQQSQLNMPTSTETTVIPDENIKSPSTIVNPELLALIYKLILSSVPVSQTQAFLEKVKNYIHQMINQGIDLNKAENFKLLLNHVKLLTSQITTEPTPHTTLPTLFTQQINPEYLKNLYELIVSSVETDEQKEFILGQLQNYIKELGKKGVDLSVTNNLYVLDAFVRQMIDSIIKSQTKSPLGPIIPTDDIPGIDRETLHYGYDLIRNFIRNPHQEEIAIQYFHNFLKLAGNSNVDLNNKENIYQVIMSIIDFVKDNITSTPIDDFNQLNTIPKSVEITYILNTKMQYGRSGVVKYRVPFDTFINNIRDILVRTPVLRSHSKLEGVLRSASNITEVSPELQEVPIDRLINLISHSGSFVDAEIPRDDSKFSKNVKDLNTLQDFKKIVFELDEKVNNNSRSKVETLKIFDNLNSPQLKSADVTEQYSPNFNRITKVVNGTYFRRKGNEITTRNESLDAKEAETFSDKTLVDNKSVNTTYKGSDFSEGNITAVNEPISEITSASKVIDHNHNETIPTKNNNILPIVSEPVNLDAGISSSDKILLNKNNYDNTENVTRANIEQ